MAVYLPIHTSFNNKGLKEAEKGFKDLEGAQAKAKYALGKANKYAAVALGALSAAALTAVKDAVDYGETLNAVFVTFGNKGSKEIGKLADASAKTYGLSKTDFNNMAVSFSNFAKDLETPQKNASSIVKDLAGRVADFASVMNISVPDAAAKMASALAGEAEPMKKFGINISNAAVEAFALEKGIGVAGEKMTDSEKAVARYGLLMEKTSVYAGDFANTSDSLANKQKILGAEFDNLKISIGQNLQPAVEAVLPFLQGMASWAQKNPDMFTVIALAIAGIAGAVVAINIAMALNPFALIAIGVGTLITAIVIAYKKFELFRDIVRIVVNEVASNFEFMANAFITMINVVIKGINLIKPGKDIGTLGQVSIGRLGGNSGGAGGANPAGLDYKAMATGGIVTSPTMALIGEAGPEAVIPLSKAGGIGSNVTINVNGGDPQAVVNALRRYMQLNGSVPIRVSV